MAFDFVIHNARKAGIIGITERLTNGPITEASYII